MLASLFRQFTNKNVYRTGSVKIWKIRRKLFVDIGYGYFYSVCYATAAYGCSNRLITQGAAPGRWGRNLMSTIALFCACSVCRVNGFLSPWLHERRKIFILRSYLYDTVLLLLSTFRISV